MQVHRCRFVDYKPSAISALSLSKPLTIGNKIRVQECRLACARDNGNIEIWNPYMNWSLEKTLYGSMHYSIESLIWAQDTSTKSPLNRLFSAGLDGIIREWDLVSLTIKYELPSNGGAIWSMAVSNDGTRIALGCEDGCVRIFKIVSLEELPFYDSPDVRLPTLEYVSSLDKINGRVLSLAWDPTDRFIVAGSSVSSVHKLDVKTGRMIQRSTLPKKYGEDTLVWTLTVLHDGTVVTGDSLGQILFWDNRTWTLSQTIKAHKADVLTLVTDQKGTTLFSAGIDRVITKLSYVQSSHKSFFKWVSSGERRYHSHDIRALSLLEDSANGALISGGVDSTLIAATHWKDFPKCHLNRMSPFPKKDVIQLAAGSRKIMYQSENILKLWGLGNISSLGRTNEDVSDQVLLPLENPKNLIAEMKLSFSGNIQASALSMCGTMIAASDSKQLKMFRLSYKSQHNRPRITKISVPSHVPGATALQFTQSGNRLIVAGSDSNVYVLDIKSPDSGSTHHTTVSAVFDNHKKKNKSTILSLAISEDEQWLGSGDDKKFIYVYNMDSLKYHCDLPVFSGLHMSMAFSKHQPCMLAVATSDNQVFEFDLEQKRLSEWCRQNSHRFPTRFLERKENIRGLFYSSDESGKLFVWATTYLICIDLKLPLDSQLEIHEKRMTNVEKLKGGMSTESFANFKMTYRFSPTMFLGELSPGELVSVERPILKMMESLPPSFFKKTYGT